MTRILKTLANSIFIVVLFSLPAFSEQLQEITGKIVGINCMMHEADCDSEMYQFYHQQFEPDFVLVVGKDKHYMLPNVPRDIKIRITGETATVVGTTTKLDIGINVDSLKVDGKVVWSKKLQREMLIKEANKYGGN